MNRLFLSAVLSGCAAASALKAQVTTTLTLTPGQNALGVTSTHLDANGTVAGTTTAAGSDVTQWTGTITVQLNDAFNPTAFTILSANLTAANGGSYVPGDGGTLGNSPANYSFGYPGSSTLTTLAIRGEQATLGSTSLPLSGSAGNYSFSPAGVTFGPSGRVEHRSANVIGNPAGTTAFSNSLADAATAAGSLTQSGSALSIQLPLDSTFSVNLLRYDGGSAGTATFRILGTLNATGAIPEPSTWALVAAGLAGLAVARARRS